MFVLFVTANDPNSERARKLADPKLDTIRLVSRTNKPTWINGVPTLVDMQSGATYEGSQCLKVLQQRAPVRGISATESLLRSMFAPAMTEDAMVFTFATEMAPPVSPRSPKIVCLDSTSSPKKIDEAKKEDVTGLPELV